MKVIPGQVFNTRITIHQGYCYLCSKLHCCLCLAPHDGAHPGLVQADNPVIHALASLLVHLFLLGIQHLNHLELFLIFLAQTVFDL